MASSNIKLFDENKGNMLTDTEFNISTQRLNGLQTGVASSQLQNKAMYQASLVAYAIAQVMMQNGLNANDTDAVSAFVANLSGTLLQKVHDLATTEEAQAGVATGKWMSPALVKAAIDTLAAKSQNILSDATKELYGLESTATPDDVFAYLGNFKKSFVSQYLWEKYKAIVKSNFNSYISSSEYTLARISIRSTDSEYNYDYTLYYANSYYIDTDNKFHLKDYTAGPTFNKNNYTDNVSKFNVLKGKYVIAFDTHYGIVFDGSSSNMLLIDASANFTVNDSYPYWSLYVSGSTVYNYPLGWVEKQDLSYLTSDSPTAYPPVIDDGYTYNLLGLVGDGPHKVEIKRYVGTGTWGASNPTILTFDKDPLMVMMLGWYDSARWKGADSNWDTGNQGNRTIVFPQLMGSSWESEQGLYSGDAYNNQVQGKYENKKLYCYAQANSNPTTNDRSYIQFNQKNYVYVYMVVY